MCKNGKCDSTALVWCYFGLKNIICLCVYRKYEVLHLTCSHTIKCNKDLSVL